MVISTDLSASADPPHLVVQASIHLRPSITPRVAPPRGLRLTADGPLVCAHHFSNSVLDKLRLTIFAILCHPAGIER